MNVELVESVPLPVLARQINDEHASCEQSLRAGLAHAFNAGRLLLEAKALVQHGEWKNWIADNLDVSAWTAQGYMRVAKRQKELESKSETAVSLLSFREALAVLREPKAPTEKKSETAVTVLPEQEDCPHCNGTGKVRNAEKPPTKPVAPRSAPQSTNPPPKPGLAPTRSYASRERWCNRCQRIGAPTCEKCRAL